MVDDDDDGDDRWWSESESDHFYLQILLVEYVADRLVVV